VLGKRFQEFTVHSADAYSRLYPLFGLAAQLLKYPISSRFVLAHQSMSRISPTTGRKAPDAPQRTQLTSMIGSSEL
jgi:hypothetical protein